MKNTYRVAIGVGSAALFLSSLAFAAAGSTLSGTWGDPGKATLDAKTAETTLTFPCELYTFPGKIELSDENHGTFTATGTAKSALPASNPTLTPVRMTGSVIIPFCPIDVKCGDEMTITLTNLETDEEIGTYTLTEGVSGVGITCQ